MAITTEYYVSLDAHSISTTPQGFAGSASAGAKGSAVLNSVQGSSTVDIALSGKFGQPITTVTQAGSDGALCTLASGEYVAVTDDGTSIRCSIIAADGESVSPVILAKSGDLSSPAVAALDGGGFAVAYRKTFSATDSDIRISVRGADGSEVKYISVDGSLAQDQAPAIAALEDGGIAVAWQRVVSGSTQIWYAVYDAAGNVVKSPTMLDSYGAINRNPTIIGTEDGGFAIAYEDDGWSGDDTDISVARFTAGGANVTIVNATDNAEDDAAPVLTKLSNGMLMLGSTHQAEPGDRDIILSLIGEDNEVLGRGDRTIVTDEFDPSLAALANGYFNLVYTDPGEDGLTAIRFNAARYSDGDDADDTMIGDSLDDNFDGWGGEDVLRGYGGSDRLGGGKGVDQMFGGAGRDLLSVHGGDLDVADPQAGEILNGGSGFDILSASDVDFRTSTLVSIEKVQFALNYQQEYFIKVWADQIGNGLAANLVIEGEPNTNKCVFDVTMGAANTLNLSSFGFEGWGDAGDHILVRGDGAAETIVGSSSRDQIRGAGGMDKLTGGGGKDILRGGLGDDIYTVDQAGEAFESAGQGSDLVRSSVTYTLGANIERMVLLGNGNINGVGNVLANGLTGNAGNNVLNGGEGKDVMTGGDGIDAFLFNSALDASTNVDRITDFETGTDKIRLDDAIFTGLTNAGRAAAFHVGSGAADASDRIIYNKESGALFFDADGAGGAAAVRFGTLDAGLELKATDFVII